jgi:ubiquitin-like domain-containing CTD phosphatase 1
MHLNTNTYASVVLLRCAIFHDKMADVERAVTDETGKSGQVQIDSKAKEVQEPNDAPAAMMNEEQEHYCFAARYAKVQLEVRLTVEDTVQDLKAILFSMTDVPPERQKILGLVRGKLPDDATTLGQLVFPPASLRDSPHPITGEKRITINLIGTPLEQTFKDPELDVELSSTNVKVAREAGSGDVDYSDEDVIRTLAIVPTNDSRAQSKLQRAISRFSLTFPVMHEPRANLRGGLLVLDLDYTMADTKKLLNYQRSAREAERPGLHELLAAVYPYYDICVWSQTNYWWLEAKLTELGCLTNERYRISFVLDRTPMFAVRNSPKGGANSSEAHLRRSKHEVKALEIIWKRFPDIYGPHNTIHVDDLARNFAMNPYNGIRIKAYKHSPKADDEFVALQRYLFQLAHPSIVDFRHRKGHKDWRTADLPSVKDDDEQSS